MIPFAELMAGLGPFEAAPILAVAVSGGADSMALALLADTWASGQGGRIVALTVDHRLRPESAAEARQVAEWLGGRGIEHHVLPWLAAALGPDLQAVARHARYALLEEWCRRHCVLHLLMAHHQDDQAETLLIRLARGSGVDGLAAMAPAVCHSDLQILRPLLGVSGAALRAYLRGQQQEWIEDPSNQAERFERVRWRKIMAVERVSAERLALTAAQMGRARQALEAETASLAVQAIDLHAAGFAWLDFAPVARAPREIALRMLAALTRCIGGRDFPPRLEGIERLLGGLEKRRTFAGCVLSPHMGRILVHREARTMAPPVELRERAWTLWDARFSMRVENSAGSWVGALGEAGARSCRDSAEKAGIPRAVLPTLPAIMDKHGILAVPPLGWVAAGTGSGSAAWAFTPAYPLAGAAFRLVKTTARTM